MQGQKLRQNKNHKQIFNLLNHCRTSSTYLVAWKLIGDVKVTAEMKLTVVRKGRNELVLVPLMSELENFQKIVTDSDKVNFFIPSEVTMFQSKVKELAENKQLTVLLPDMMAHVERRKHLRLPLADNHLIVGAEFYKCFMGQRLNTQSFEKNCYDISAGGMSFIISKIEQKFFNNGDIIKSVLIKLDHDIMVQANMKIVNILPIGPEENQELMYKGLKVCLKFTEISERDRKIIDSFVFKHYKYEEVA